jgi:hypothetical protein
MLPSLVFFCCHYLQYLKWHTQGVRHFRTVLGLSAQKYAPVIALNRPVDRLGMLRVDTDDASEGAD